MIAEVIFFSLMYYVAGVLLSLACFHREYLWNLPLSEHGPVVVGGYFLFNLIWPIMAVVIFALSVRNETRRRRGIAGVYYGD